MTLVIIAPPVTITIETRPCSQRTGTGNAGRIRNDGIGCPSKFKKMKLRAGKALLAGIIQVIQVVRLICERRAPHQLQKEKVGAI